jgi:hypothetical protein
VTPVSEGVSSQLYMQVGSLYLVPVLRSRLSFALLFRRAFEHLSAITTWDGRQDLLCVSLPPAVRSCVLKGIGKLPMISQIWAESSTDSAREVFPVTPCDAFVEAVRLSMERTLSIQFLDVDIAPGNILRPPCERDPGWPDDGFLQLVGIDKYMALVYPHLTQPPMRFEPTDTWREAHISQRIKEIYPCWRRILFVCDMSIATAIRASLIGPSVRTVAPDLGGPARVRLQGSLNLSVILSYLDDFPRLVERYENLRNFSLTTLSSLDKQEMLLDEIQEFMSRTRDISISTRQIEKFSVLLNNHLRLSYRRVPDAQTIFFCMQDCFGKAAAERLHCHLAGYFNQISVERVRPRGAKESETYRYKLDVDSHNAKYESRQCDPTPPRYEVTRINTSGKSKGDSSEYGWPPENAFLKAMQRKMIGLGKRLETENMVRRFEGSVERGIDTRRTLRSVSGHVPTLYVRAFRRTLSEMDVEREPTLWLLSDEFEAERYFVQSGHFHVRDKTPSGGRQVGRSFFISWQDFHKLPSRLEDVTLYKDEEADLSIFGLRRLARITFGDHFETEAAARSAYGDSFEQRVPNHKEFEHPEPYGCIHPELVSMAEEQASWVEVAALTAARYAAKTVLVVASAGMQFPPSITSSRLCASKKFIFVSLEEFSREERDKLQTHYRLSGKKDADTDWEQFERLMRRFWT